LRALAGVRGWKLNEYGLFAGKRKIAGEREEDIYGKLGLQFIPPELREDRGEIVEARERRLPSLMTAADIRGDLYVKFDWQDDAADVDQFVAAAQSLDYRYLALVGDGRRLRRPHVDLARLRARLNDAGRARENGGVSVFAGVDAGILPDGSLDLPDEIIKLFDFVVAVMPARSDAAAAEQTERLVRAAGHPRVSLLVLPAGPGAGQSGSCAFDAERVIAAAGEAGCLLALSGDSAGFDLDDAYVRAAKASGAAIAIGTCADRPQALARMRFAVDVARRGWLTADLVVNTRPADVVRSLLVR
jgi:DNA polymerase (family 10)